MKKICCLLVLLTIGLSSGCAGMTKNLSSVMPWGEKKSQITESKYQAPVKIVALWSPAMYNSPGKPATRGFGGRLYFYNSKNEPIPVQGQLVVYCFDDTDKTRDHKQPDRRVAFTPEQFSGHYSATELGASYSIWVPWDAIGNPQVEVGLVPIFTAATGQVVMGEQSLGLLPGPESPIQEKRLDERVLSAKATQQGDVTHIGFDEEIGAPRGRKGRIQTTSIALPDDLAERVAASRNKEAAIVPQVAGLKPAALVQESANQLPTGQGSKSAAGNDASEGVKESLDLPRPPRRLGPLTHSERSQPQAQAWQPPRPTHGPAPTQQPLSGRPSSLP